MEDYIMWEKLKWKKLDDKAKALYQQRRFSEAISVAKEALKVAEDKFGSNHSNVATSLNNLAGLLHDQGKLMNPSPLSRQKY
jgi:HD superfamily phosphohydrolase YqeK